MTVVVVEDADFDVDGLSDTALSRLTDRCLEAARYRECLVEAFKGKPELAGADLALSGHESGMPWRQPLGAFDAYPAGWIVEHAGKTWESLLDANTWEPGVSGWRELPTDGQVPEWVQPTGAHDAYQAGDQVTWQGRLWESTSDGNVWEPGTPGTSLLWTDLGPIEGGEDLEPDPEEQAD